MRIASVWKVIVLSSITFGALFLWTWSWDPWITEVPIRIETFNNRKSLSVEGFQSQEQKSHEKNQWQDPNLELGRANSVVNQSDGTRKTLPDISGKDNFFKVNKTISQKNSSTSKAQTRVLLVSYMRAGSTFTGDLFQFSPGVLYIYEPLLYTNDMDELQKGISVRNRVISKFVGHSNPPETQDLLESLLHCKLTVKDMKFILGHSYSQSFKDFLSCKNNPQTYQIEECVANLTKKCQGSDNIIAKVLRLKMWEVDELMSRDPQLKVIHLVRDPRGIVMSRRVASYYLDVNSLCHRITTDAELNLKLQTKYPGRLLTLRYEDLAMHPLAITERLYAFAGVVWNDVIASRVQNITSPKDKIFQERIFSTKRKNSTATAFNWRHTLDFRSAYNAQTLCSKMMSRYSYRHFKNDIEMRDLKIPSMDEKYDENLFKAEVS